MRSVYGVRDGYPQLVVLDTTDEAHDSRRRSRGSSPRTTLFLVASKSGGTIESASMEKLLLARMSAALGVAAGRHFVAITDPGTALAQLGGIARLSRDVPQPARHRRALLGAVALRPRAGARSSARRCASCSSGGADDGGRLPAGEPRRIPASSSARSSAHAADGPRQADGRPAAVAAVARPVDRTARRREHRQARQGRAAGRRRAARARPTNTARDRAFVAISHGSRRTRRGAAGRARGGRPSGAAPEHAASTALGAEFFRWEFATAVAGAALGINPFDEPNVSEAKEKTKALLGEAATSRGGAAGRRRPAAIAASSVTVHRRRRRRDVVRAAHRVAQARATTSRSSRTCPREPAIEAAVAGVRAGDPRAHARRQHLRRRAALPALDRAVPQGRAEHGGRVRDHGGGRDRDADPGGAVIRSRS